jgi:hypothetical protein
MENYHVKPSISHKQSESSFLVAASSLAAKVANPSLLSLKNQNQETAME